MRSYGSPSYYAQVMFAAHLGTEKPASTLEGVGARFFYSVTENPSTKRLYLKLVNASSDSQTLDIRLDGASLAPRGQLTSLSAHDTQATNTIDHPDDIVPVTTAVPVSGSTLHHTVPGYSIQVLQLELR